MKYIFIDWSYFQFRAIFSWVKEKTYPPTYRALSYIVRALKDVEIQREDVVIFALDCHTGSWRKEIDKNYKANRKENREKFEIDWEDQYKAFDKFLKNIDEATNFYLISLDKMEADDIIAVGCKKFQDHVCIVVSTDSDFEQLVVYPKVKLFSPMSHKYKEVKNPYKILANKIAKERTDNLVSPIQSLEDYDRRNKIVNLMSLPSLVEKIVSERLDVLPEKKMDLSLLYHPSLQERMSTMYSENKQLNLM